MNRNFGKRTEPCNPTVNGEDNTLMSGDGEFLDEKVIDKKCACVQMDTCKTIVNLLKNKKIDVAKEIITQIFNT